jgi:hypothetical protein
MPLGPLDPDSNRGRSSVESAHLNAIAFLRCAPWQLDGTAKFLSLDANDEHATVKRDLGRRASPSAAGLFRSQPVQALVERTAEHRLELGPIGWRVAASRWSPYALRLDQTSTTVE